MNQWRPAGQIKQPPIYIVKTERVASIKLIFTAKHWIKIISDPIHQNINIQFKWDWNEFNNLHQKLIGYLIAFRGVNAI